jgi:hypothetical protein
VNCRQLMTRPRPIDSRANPTLYPRETRRPAEDLPVTGLLTTDHVVHMNTPDLAELEKLRSELADMLSFNVIHGTQELSPKTEKLVEGGRLSIVAAKGEHRLSIMEHGVGTYYGSDSIYARMDETKKRNYVTNAATDAIGAGANPKSTDCMEWSMEHLSKAYERAGMSARWAQIDKKVRNEASSDPRLQMRATVLAQELQKDGWEAVYFNPDVPHTKNLPDVPAQQAHKDSVRLVIDKKAPYYGLHVKHQVLNYSPRARSGTTPDSTGIDKLEQVPFFFGFARAGYHSFVGYDGKVSEVHRNMGPEDAKLIDEVPLRQFVWDSGIIMVPPKTWPKKK